VETGFRFWKRKCVSRKRVSISTFRIPLLECLSVVNSVKTIVKKNDPAEKRRVNLPASLVASNLPAG
jgi:hypothetical protein